MRSSTWRMVPDWPELDPSVRVTWSPDLKYFISWEGRNETDSFISICYGIMVTCLSVVSITTPIRFFRSPSTTRTLSPNIKEYNLFWNSSRLLCSSPQLRWLALACGFYPPLIFMNLKNYLFPLKWGIYFQLIKICNYKLKLEIHFDTKYS